MKQESYVLLDMRGLVMHAHYSGKDPELEQTETAEVLNPPGFTIETLWDRYLKVILQAYTPMQIIAVWEGGNDFRLSLDPKYKSNRKKGSEVLQEHLRGTMQHVVRFLDNMGILQVHVPGVEADDVLAWLAQKLPGSKLIYTVDHDLVALADEHVHVYVKDALYGLPSGNDFLPVMEEVEFKSNGASVKVPLRFVSLYKSLVGDSSDGYTGVAGFGIKTWGRFVTDFGIEGLEELEKAGRTGAFGEVRKAAQENPQDSGLRLLVDQLAQWSKSYSLARLWPDLIYTYDPTQDRIRAPVWHKRLPSMDRMVEHMEEIGSRSLSFHTQQFLPKFDLITADHWTEDAVMSLIASNAGVSPFISFDLETWAPTTPAFEEAKAKQSTFVDVFQSHIVGAGFTFGKYMEKTVYISFDHKDTVNFSKDFLSRILSAIPSETSLVVHNAGFEYPVCARDIGLSIEPCIDTRILAAHVDENESTALKDLSRRWLKYEQPRYADVVPEGLTMRDITGPQVAYYGLDDPFVTAHLYHLFSIISKLEGTYAFATDEEMAAQYIISEGYMAGVGFDVDLCKQQGKEDARTKAEAMARIRAHLVSDEATTFMQQADITELYEDRIAVALGRARKKNGGEITEDVASGIRVGVEEDLLAACAYAPLTTVSKEIPFTATLKQLNTLIDMLNTGLTPTGGKVYEALPPLEKKTAASITAYLAECGSPGRVWTAPQKGFLDRLPTAQRGGDYSALAGMYRQYKRDKEGLETTQSGTELNFGSPKQMQELLYGMLGLPIRIRKLEISDERVQAGLETGTPQTNKDAIAAALAYDLQEDSWRKAVVKDIKLAQECDTRIENFYTSYPLWVYPDGLIRPQIKSLGTETHRPSGSNPNALQWPKRGDGLKFRRCITPNPALGHNLIISIDWNQEELREQAGLSRDPALSSCYIGSDVADLVPACAREIYGDILDIWLRSPTRDVHSLTGTEIAATKLHGPINYEEFERVRKDSEHPHHKIVYAARRDAKPVNFGSSYGIGPPKLSRELLCSIEEARSYLEAKKRLYAGYERWKEKVIEFARMHGYVETLFGTRRHAGPDLFSKDEGIRGHLERSLINFLIQGLAADILKRTLKSIRQEGILDNTGAILYVPLYDELVFSCHADRTVELILGVHKHMTAEIPGFPIPLLAEPSLGINFGVQIEIGSRPTAQLIEEAMEKALGVTQRVAA